MSVSIVPNSTRITVTQRPTIEPPMLLYGGKGVTCGSTMMEAAGEVTLGGATGDKAENWQIGWIQIERVQTNWGYYRGRLDSHGSIFVQRARAPARPQQHCRDIAGSGAANDIFYNLEDNAQISASTAAFPLRVRAVIQDNPGGGYDFTEKNSLTGEPNFLQKFQRESHFCAVFSALEPNGVFHHLAHFYWNVRWQIRLRPTSFEPLRFASPTVVRQSTGATVGDVINGRPSDSKILEMLSLPQKQTCNQIAGNAKNLVGIVGSPNRRESPVWKDFDVRV